MIFGLRYIDTKIRREKFQEKKNKEKIKEEVFKRGI